MFVMQPSIVGCGTFYLDKNFIKKMKLPALQKCRQAVLQQF